MAETNLLKRILAVWDFRNAPYSIGDLVILHERLQILRWIHRLDQVDISFVCDPECPVRTPEEQGVTPENFHRHFPSLVSTVYLNPHVGSVLLFDSHAEFENYLTGNAHRYLMWPPPVEYLGRHPSYADNFDAIQDFFRKHGFIPYVDCRPSSLQQACEFYEAHVRPDFPVTVHLRNNPHSGNTWQNADVGAWLGFFKRCEGLFPVKFMMIGAVRELDARFRGLPNVVIAKDYGTSVDQDLVLIRTSLAHMGTASGPSTMAVFSRTPYLLYRYSPANESVAPGAGFNFATDSQKLIWREENESLLFEQFSDIFSRTDKKAWEARNGEWGAAGPRESYRSRLLWAE